jgi:hypothetical protein
MQNMHTHLSSFHQAHKHTFKYNFLIYPNLNTETWSQIGLQKAGCYRPSPLKRISSRDSLAKRGVTQEIIAKVIFTFPSGLIFGVIAPLNLVHVDFLSTGETDILLQNTDWPLAVGQVVVKVNGILINLLEGFGLVGGLETLA